MTYAVGGNIEASDLNNFLSTGTPNINGIWSTGTGNSGYGQPALSTVSAGNVVFATEWAGLINTIAAVANHQNSTITSITPPSTGDTISYNADISTNLNTINSGRLNARTSGSTTTNTVTNPTPWGNLLTMTITASFANSDAARYYFNAGGQMGLSFAHTAITPDPEDNEAIREVCASTGTMWLSSPTSGEVNIGGLLYNGIHNTGNSANRPGNAVTNNGFYALTGSLSTCYTQPSFSNSSMASANLIISASYNSSGTVTFQCQFVPGGTNYGIGAGTASTLTIRPPSTAYIANTWGSIAVANTIVAT